MVSKDADGIVHLYIGLAIRHWALLELTLSLHLAGFLGTDQFRARIVWASIPNLRVKRELLSSLAKTYLEESVLTKYRRLLRRLKTLGEFRNTLAHSPVMWIDNDQYRFVTDKANKDGGADFAHEVRYQLNNIKNLPQDIEKLNQDFSRLLGDMRMYTSAKMHRE